MCHLDVHEMHTLSFRPTQPTWTHSPLLSVTSPLVISWPPLTGAQREWKGVPEPKQGLRPEQELRGRVGGGQITVEWGCLLPLCCLQRVTAAPSDQFSMDHLVTWPWKIFPSLPCENTYVMVSSYMSLVYSSFNFVALGLVLPVRLTTAVGPASLMPSL